MSSLGRGFVSVSDMVSMTVEYIFGSHLVVYSLSYISQRHPLTARPPPSTRLMSEYWVSKKRYFCKYCDVYIADDVPSRQHHENGLRHKGNVERFVRGLYKAGEKRKKDAEEEKREMRRIEQVRFYSLFPPIFA